MGAWRACEPLGARRASEPLGGRRGLASPWGDAGERAAPIRLEGGQLLRGAEGVRALWAAWPLERALDPVFTRSPPRSSGPRFA